MEPTWKKNTKTETWRPLDLDKIQQEWHNLATYFYREHMKIEGIKKSGAGTDEVFKMKWAYYASLEFCMDKSISDAAVSTHCSKSKGINKNFKS